ncbi:MAG: hypothetical protein OQK42_06940 [Sedimenticola sp.]|nr:hypothetical protein [Sedimenticola sp.]MCW8947102.1 hypothetical protein [Sedimenticola sp.]MCW8949125.1 hypothetical protein [Sedimenticola sp.]MCW8976761.1 hypothetical protein [Sedimenticola sp.]MCW9022690.1 hypothetical protein [Sedimenticola sp.]
MNSPEDELKRKNIRLAWILGAFALIVLITAFPFWQNIFKVLGSAVK